MGVTTFTQEYTTPVAPGRMFKALILDSHNLFPKLVPQSIKSIEFLQGDGAAGSIKQTNFPKGGEYGYLIHRIDALDVENYMSRYTLIEGSVLGDKLECISDEVKFEAAGEGCVCKVTSHYHTKGDIELSEEEIKVGTRLWKSTSWHTLISMLKYTQLYVLLVACILINIVY